MNLTVSISEKKMTCQWKRMLEISCYIMALFLTIGCASTQKCDPREVPDWLTSTPHDDTYFYAIGISGRTRNVNDAWIQAGNRGRAELGRIIFSHVSSQDTMINTSRGQYSSQLIDILSDTELNYTEVIERWYDPVRGLWPPPLLLRSGKDGQKNGFCCTEKPELTTLAPMRIGEHLKKLLEANMRQIRLFSFHFDVRKHDPAPLSFFRPPCRHKNISNEHGITAGSKRPFVEMSWIERRSAWDLFSIQTSERHLLLYERLSAPKPDTTIIHHWYLNGKLKASVTLPVNSASWRTWSSKDHHTQRHGRLDGGSADQRMVNAIESILFLVK